MEYSVNFDGVSHSTRARTVKVQIHTKCMSNDSNAKATCPWHTHCYDVLSIIVILKHKDYPIVRYIYCKL